MNTAQGTQNYLYLYDLPKDQATSTRLASVLQPVIKNISSHRYRAGDSEENSGERAAAALP